MFLRLKFMDEMDEMDFLEKSSYNNSSYHCISCHFIRSILRFFTNEMEMMKWRKPTFFENKCSSQISQQAPSFFAREARNWDDGMIVKAIV